MKAFKNHQITKVDLHKFIFLCDLKSENQQIIRIIFNTKKYYLVKMTYSRALHVQKKRNKCRTVFIERKINYQKSKEFAL